MKLTNASDLSYYFFSSFSSLDLGVSSILESDSTEGLRTSALFTQLSNEDMDSHFDSRDLQDANPMSESVWIGLSQVY